MNDRVTDITATVGLDVNLDKARPDNTLLPPTAALRRNINPGQRTHERLMHAYFTEGNPIGDRDELLRLATEVGLDEGGTAAVLDGDAFDEEERARIALAQRFGATGVPFSVFDRRYAISGAQEAATFVEVLETCWARTRIPGRPVDTKTVPAGSRPDHGRRFPVGHGVLAGVTRGEIHRRGAVFATEGAVGTLTLGRSMTAHLIRAGVRARPIMVCCRFSHRRGPSADCSSECDLASPQFTPP